MDRISAWAADLAATFYKCFIREDRYKLLLGGIGVTIKISLVAVLLGGPYDAALAAEADAVVAAYEYTALSAGSVADALKTGVFRGRLPVKL